MVQQTILYNTAAKWGGSEWQTILGAAIVQTGAPMLRVIFSAYISYGVLILSITFFQAIGKAGGASILALARQLVLFLPLVVILPHVAGLGVKGVFYAQLITDLVVLLLAIILILEMMKLPDDFSVYKLKLAVVNAILLLMQRKDKRDSTDLYFSGTTGRKVQNVRRIINTNLEKEISIEELSEKVNLNRTTLQKVFKEMYGLTINEYRTKSRIQLAKNLLASTDLSITEIAGRCGYANASKFSKVFKRNEGILPKNWRE